MRRTLKENPIGTDGERSISCSRLTFTLPENPVMSSIYPSCGALEAECTLRNHLFTVVPCAWSLRRPVLVLPEGLLHDGVLCRGEDAKV